MWLRLSDADVHVSSHVWSLEQWALWEPAVPRPETLCWPAAPLPIPHPTSQSFHVPEGLICTTGSWGISCPSACCSIIVIPASKLTSSHYDLNLEHHCVASVKQVQSWKFSVCGKFSVKGVSWPNRMEGLGAGLSLWSSLQCWHRHILLLALSVVSIPAVSLSGLSGLPPEAFDVCKHPQPWLCQIQKRVGGLKGGSKWQSTSRSTFHLRIVLTARFDCANAKNV